MTIPVSETDPGPVGARCPQLRILAPIAYRKVGFRSLDIAWTDTAKSHEQPMQTVLGGLAEFERDLIRAHTGEHRQRAKARDFRLGCTPKLSPHQQPKSFMCRGNDEPTCYIMRSLNVQNSMTQRIPK